MMKITKFAKLIGQWLGTVDDGKQLEILAASNNGEVMENAPYPLATVVADENEVLYLEIYTKGGALQLPVSDLKELFSSAEGEVHSEEWYEKNVYDAFDNSSD
jgi:hypothetical protein